jgi:hypothetical protein
MIHMPGRSIVAGLVLGLACCRAPVAFADAVTTWNARATDVVAAAKLATPVANRVIAIVQTAVYEATNAVPVASRDAAIAAANRTALTELVPSQKEAIARAYQEALAGMEGGGARDSGIAAGDKAATDVIARRADDGAAVPESYRPATAPGVYVPTTIPAVPGWPHRKPWLMTSASQFRPAPPPMLDSALWARDYNEVKTLGARNGSTRTAEQTDIARFWEATLPSIYYGVVRSVADRPGRDALRNARLYAAIAQGMDDAVIAVFDAKYHYGFWRPVTAIRNGDADGNDATLRDAGWTPFIETPMHPEYPCAHCILSATVGTILQAEAGGQPVPELSTTSYMVEGVTRRWKTTEDFIQEVALARIYDGVHYRNSTEIGTAMGRRVGELVATKLLGTKP